MKLTAPPMGFNTWNTFGENINDELLRSTADKIIELGLKDIGYEYVVIDDCWAERSRDENGRLVPSREKFPNGIKAVADYIHSKGLKFGIYSCVGNRTCANYPGSLEHEFIDAETFAEWGVDYLKYDYCYKPISEQGHLLYKRMSLALANCGRDILFSACNWANDDSKCWMKSTGAHIWRMSGDVSDNWNSIANIYRQQIEMLPYNSTACINDMDMLVVGMNGKGNVGLGGCSEEEYKTHFAMWCLLGSPLMIGSDIREIDEKALGILKNKELIDICLDGRGCQPYKVDGGAAYDHITDVWVRHLENGDIAVAMFNMSDEEKNGIFQFVNAGINSSCGCVLDFCELYTGEEILGVRDELLTEPIPPHGCKIYRAKLRKA